MAPTIEDIKALDFGYITGNDLLKYCPLQLLQKKYTVDDKSVEDGVIIAYSEVISKLSTKCDINSEFLKRGSQRYFLITKITAIASVRNIVSDLPGIPDNMKSNFDWLRQEFEDIRNGNESLPNAIVAEETIVSKTELIQNSFGTLG